MECTEVQKRLSAYREKIISPKQKALIDEHLEGCRKCKLALADLKKTIEYVKKLEEVEPPAWLTQKVMARVRSEAEAKRGIWQRFFYPFHIKLPLEALAVIFLTVGAIYIFKAMQPEMQLARAPIETKETVPRAKAPEKQKAPAADKERPAPSKLTDQFMYDKYDKKVETREERAVAAVRAPAEMAKQEAVAPAAGAAYRDESRRSFAPSSKGVTSKKAAEFKAKGVHFVVNARDLEIASRDIERILRQLGGRTIKTEPLGDKAVIVAELDSNKVQELFDQLNLIGEVQGKEQERVSEGWEGAVDVRVEVVKPSRQP